MPGRFFQTLPIADLAARLDVDGTQVMDEPLRQNIAPGENIVVLEGGALKRMRWGILPVARKNARGRPVMDTIINARSETLFDKSAFEGVRRCVIPVAGWYEWTGEARKKTAWRIEREDGAPLFFAAIADTWSGPGGITLDQVAAVTCPPNDDLAEIHHRMGVLLEPSDLDLWQNGSEAEAFSLCSPLENGVLKIAEAEGVDWDAP